MTLHKPSWISRSQQTIYWYAIHWNATRKYKAFRVLVMDSRGYQE
jgi:hypothetical protein